MVVAELVMRDMWGKKQFFWMPMLELLVEKLGFGFDGLGNRRQWHHDSKRVGGCGTRVCGHLKIKAHGLGTGKFILLILMINYCNITCDEWH